MGDIKINNTHQWKSVDDLWIRDLDNFNEKLSHPSASINIGAGLNIIHEGEPNWINHDGDFNEKLDIVCRWENFSPIPDSTFVRAITTDTVEHIMPINYDLVFSEWNRILKIGAILSGTTPNRDYIIKAAYEGLQNTEWVVRNLWGDQHGVAHTHYHVFTKKELSDLLGKYGFETTFDSIDWWISFSAVKVKNL